MHFTLEYETTKGVSLRDITPDINRLIEEAEIKDGVATICSQHTTTAITINENEERLLDDVKRFFHRLLPPSDTYFHNDIDERDCPDDEPENAHAHIAAMLLGTSERVPVQDGRLRLGQWQSVMFVDLDGPRPRTLAVHICADA